MEIYFIGTLLSLIIILIAHFRPPLQSKNSRERETIEFESEIPKGWEDYYNAVKNSIPQKTPSKFALILELYLYKISEVTGVLIIN